MPAIIRWPGMIPARRVISQMTITMDWTATILAAAGTQPANGFPLDGIDLLPVPYPRRSRSRADILLADWTAGRRS